MTNPLRALTVALLASAAWSCWAGRPLVTEDAAVLARGDCELETFAGHTRERDAPTTRTASLQLGCGAGSNSQVALTAAQWRTAGERARSLTLGGKTGLVAGPQGHAGTLAWGLGGLQEPGQGLRRESAYLNGVLSWSLTGSARLHANLGWSRSFPLQRNTTNWALAIERAGASGVDLMGEVFATDRDRSPWVQVAARWALQPDKLFIDASIGVQTTGARPTTGTVGLKLAF